MNAKVNNVEVRHGLSMEVGKDGEGLSFSEEIVRREGGNKNAGACRGANKQVNNALRSF